MLRSRSFHIFQHLLIQYQIHTFLNKPYPIIVYICCKLIKYWRFELICNITYFNHIRKYKLVSFFLVNNSFNIILTSRSLVHYKIAFRQCQYNSKHLTNESFLCLDICSNENSCHLLHVSRCCVSEITNLPFIPLQKFSFFSLKFFIFLIIIRYIYKIWLLIL